MNELTNHQMMFLSADPSALEGAARLLDFGDTLTHYNTSLSEREADLIAISSDWLAIGEDMQKAMDKFAAEHAEAIDG